jgi:predicted nucleic-acid-binding protein
MMSGRLCVLLGRRDEITHAIEHYQARQADIDAEIAALRADLAEHTEADILGRVLDQLPPGFVDEAG